MTKRDDSAAEERVLETAPAPARARDTEEPPASAGDREAGWAADHDSGTRDTSPALGTRGEASRWRRARRGAAVALSRGRWRDAAWSFLYRRDTEYAPPAAVADDEARAAARRARTGDLEGPVHGPVVKAPVWTWEVPLYFWFGGIAAGASFVALSCDLAGDPRSARTARKVSLAALVPSPLLLVADLGRPERFLNMLRIAKVRSPMSMGAWCLTAFGNLIAAAVGADLLKRRRMARALGGATALAGGYLGSYTGVLLATTTVPVWSRSRLFLGPIFVATATATGSAATRLALVATGVPEGHPTRTALGRVEAGAIAFELAAAALNKRRLGRLKYALEEGRPGHLFRLAEAAVGAGLALRLARRHGAWTHHLASVLYLAGGLAFRYAWVGAGQTSAGDDEAVALTARSCATVGEKGGGRPSKRGPASEGPPRRPRSSPLRLYSEAVRVLTLRIERVVRRGCEGPRE